MISICLIESWRNGVSKARACNGMSSMGPLPREESMENRSHAIYLPGRVSH